MISATIQGKYKENRGEHITAQDGKLITGEAQKKVCKCDFERLSKS
ncbi:hypothetical protein [Helicobacter sp. 23-1045]